MWEGERVNILQLRRGASPDSRRHGGESFASWYKLIPIELVNRTRTTTPGGHEEDSSLLEGRIWAALYRVAACL